MPAEPSQTPQFRVLVLAQTGHAPNGLSAALSETAEIQTATSIDDLVNKLRVGNIDAVLCAPPELVPLANATARDRAGSVLEGVGQGVCVIDRDGQLKWANATVRSYSGEIVEQIRRTCAELLEDLASDTGEPIAVRVRQRSVQVGTEYTFDLSVSALPNAEGQIVEAIGLFSDTSAASRLRERLDAIDAAGAELIALDVDETEQLEVHERLELLEEKLIRYCRDLLHFTHFAVMVLDPKTEHLDTVLAGGFSEEARSIDIYARKDGNGISGYVAATGKSYICPDIQNDPLYLRGFECAASSLTVPLRLVDRVVGILNIEADKPDAFTEEDRQVAEIFARYIAVALHTLKLLAVQRSETTDQVASDVSAEASTPLNDINSEISLLLERFSEDAEVGPRLRTVLDGVDRVKNALRTAAERPAIRGLVSAPPDTDPVLKGKRVLIADDEDIIRETVSDVLMKTGALTVTARDGLEAIAMIRSQRFDLVLSDIKMPNKNGYEVFATAKQVDPQCPVILITGFGYDPEHAIVRASREGLAAVLFKPFKVEQLLEAIHKAVAVDDAAPSRDS